MSEQEWHDLVKGILRSEMTRRNVTYDQLAEKLEAIGVRADVRNLRNKVARGGFSAVFFVQCLRAIGARTVQIVD
jgi:hypothetical protein